MIVIATASFIVRKGLSDIIKELYPGKKVVGISFAEELDKLHGQKKISLLLASAEILTHLNLSAYKEIQLVKL